MKLEQTKRGRYHVLSILSDITPTSDISGIESVIEACDGKDRHHIAVRFTEASYLSTKALTILVRCSQRLAEQQGNLAIIDPNKDIIDVLEITDVKSLIRVVSSEEEL